MRRLVCVIIVAAICFTILNLPAEPAYSLSLETESSVAKGNTQITIKIYKIEGTDPVDVLSKEDWYYHVGCWWKGESSIHWQSSPEPIKFNTNPLYVDRTHTFTVSSLEVYIVITLCEDDSSEAAEGLVDDLADISSDTDGGVDNVGNSIQPPTGISYWQGSYVGIYNLSTNKLTGDDVVVEMNYYKTSGEFDGSTNSDQNDAHVWFTISDNYEPPVANAGPDRTAHRGETVSFDGSGSTASAGSSIIEYRWDIGNDGIWDGSGIVFSFTIPLSFSTGVRPVKLMVVDNYGMTSIDFCNLTVLNKNPIASFTFTPTNPTTSDTVRFTDTSNDPDGTIASWLWDFGDGTQSTLQNPTHRYAKKGIYTVRLTVTDNDGGTSTVTQTITVENTNPTASFTYKPTNPTTSDTIQFTDTSTDPDGTIVSWLWDFGDGTQSTQRHPTHKYSRKGTYTVRLTVTDNDGGTSTVTKIITVENTNPTASFTYTPANPTTSDTIQFTDTSTDPDGTIVSWLWDFGDGTQSTAQNPTHRYTRKGTYTVRLTVTDNDGGTSNITKTITVEEAPSIIPGTGSGEGISLILPILIVILVVALGVGYFVLKKRKAKTSPQEPPSSPQPSQQSPQPQQPQQPPSQPQQLPQQLPQQPQQPQQPPSQPQQPP